MMRVGFGVLVLALAFVAPVAVAQDVDDKLITGTWDVTFESGGESVTGMISVARNSDGRLVGLWTKLPERERTDLVNVHYEDGSLTAEMPGASSDGKKIAATLADQKITGTFGGAAFEGMKRSKVQQPERGGRGGRGEGRGGRGQGIDVDALIKQADANGDGMLQKSEAPERMQQFFDMMDTNGDGNVSKEEAEEAFKRFQGNQN